MTDTLNTIKITLNNTEFVLPQVTIDAINAEMATRIDNVRSAVRSQVVREQQGIFAEQVMDYDNGCNDGKIAFLESIGIEVPVRTVTFTLECDLPYGSDPDEIESDLRYALPGDVSNVSCYHEVI